MMSYTRSFHFTTYLSFCCLGSMILLRVGPGVSPQLTKSLFRRTPSTLLVRNPKSLRDVQWGRGKTYQETLIPLVGRVKESYFSKGFYPVKWSIRPCRPEVWTLTPGRSKKIQTRKLPRQERGTVYERRVSKEWEGDSGSGSNLYLFT